ncbi:MAG: TonB-dependent receptor [Bacteroidales bacterium]|nr:TonB-dependent receptor [Bacteroidales bacterium]
MKLKIHILILLLTLTCNLEAQEKYQISGDYKDLSFKEFVTRTESFFAVNFFYKDEWVNDLKLSDYPGCMTLTCVMENLLRGTSLYYYIDDSGNIVITRNYAVKISNAPIEKENNFIPPTDYPDSGENQQMTGNAFVEVGNPAERYRPGKVIISGYITNRDTKEPVAGVTVFIQKLSTGTISNEYGFYTLTLPRGIHLLQFSFIGMREKKFNLNLNGTGEMNVEMNSMLIPLKETIVSAQKNMTLQRFEVGAEKINITSFRLLPTSMGESDIIKSVLLIPGVQSVGEGSAGFNVRGGSADQNLILLYGAPVYNSSHFFGFFSAVNSDIIKDVTLYKGGIPSRYGGRISSVLDITSKEGNRKEFAGNAGISPITTHLMVEGPLIKDTLTYLLTARTTYSNWIFSLIENASLQRSRASFYDFNGKITYDLNKNNKIDFSSYYSHDAFRFNSDTVYSYDNNIFVLKWRHFFNSRFFSVLSINNSLYNYDISSQDVATEAFVLSHKINSTGLKADFNWFQGRNEINFGVDLNKYTVMPGSYLPASDSSLVIPHIIEKERAWEGALYIDDKFILTNFMSINVGIRMSTFYSLGPGSVMIYDPEYSKSRSTIIDTLNFKSGEVSSRYAGPELRMSLNFRVNDKSSFKINYNRTRQYLHLLSNSTSISPTDTWKLSDYYLKPQVGDQFAIGFYKMLFKNSFETSVELYYKEIKNMVDFKGGTKLIMDENIEKDIVNVKGKAYGLELIFKKTEGKIRYSVGYTYARTFIKSIGNFSEEIINSGKWFPANFDKPNDLVVTFNYLFSRRFSFSSNYTWSTGRPITYPVATYHISDKILVHYSDRNKYRIPDYSRLDLSFKVSGNLRSRRIAHPNWTFSVYNLLGRQNVYSIYFKKEGELVKGYKLSVFGKAIPSVTFSFDF